MQKYLIGLLVAAVMLSGAHADAQAQPCENKWATLDADFEGGAMASCVAKRNSFEIWIQPEDRPINPSPWYAFRVTPKKVGTVKIIMRYGDARHRYRPKRSDNAVDWRLIAPSQIQERRKGRKVVLRLEQDRAPFFVAAQEFLSVGAYEQWANELMTRAPVTRSEVGQSVEGRPLFALTSTPEQEHVKKEHVLLVGRQHPPELTGGFAMLTFLDTVFADTQLAKRFRARFHITAIPLMNPDGVVHGHWRHNMNGVDLNRDWGPFTQPETQTVKRILDAIAAEENSELRLMLDFHSTNRNVFYTQFVTDTTIPASFTSQWIAAAQPRLDSYDFKRDERETTDLPTSKNYVYRRFGAPAITYELGDQTDRDVIRHSASVFAEEMMETLLASDPNLADKAHAGVK